jgi:PAS domain S-box-containing protein
VLERIRTLTEEEVGLLEQSLAGGRAAPVSRARTVMSELQAHISLLNDEQERSFYQARYVRDLKRQRLFRTVISCGIFGPIGTLLIHLLLAGRLVRRIQLVEENARRLAHGLPLEPFPPATDEIADLARQIEDAACLLSARDREVRESERRYRELFDQAPVPYEETDREGIVRRFNQAVCALLKCGPDRIAGRPAWQFVDPDRQEHFRAAMLERISAGTETAAFECEYLLEDGSRIVVEIRENPIRNQAGEITGVCCSLLDVTERNLAAVAARKVEQYALELRNKNEQLNRALEAARSATEAKGRFLAGISHELRTPLNAIIGFSELMQDGRLGPVSAEQRDGLADILTSARHLLGLIGDILDLSKVEAGKMEFWPEPADIGALVAEVRDVMRPIAEKKRLLLSTDVAPGLRASIDPGRFKQVLYNYLSNAVKFTPPAGAVCVRACLEDDSHFRLEVEDTGIGIAPADLPKLFREFEQLGTGRTADHGTGLGLALTRRIVEAQGGAVSARSIPGTGSVFSAVLPLNHVSGALPMARIATVS